MGGWNTNRRRCCQLTSSTRGDWMAMSCPLFQRTPVAPLTRFVLLTCTSMGTLSRIMKMHRSIDGTLHRAPSALPRSIRAASRPLVSLSLSTREKALGVGGLGASNFVLVPTGTKGLGTDRFPSTRTASRQRCCGRQFVSSSVSPRRRHGVVTEIRKMPNLARRG